MVHDPRGLQARVILGEVRYGKGPRGVPSVECQVWALGRPVVSVGAITLTIIVGRIVQYENALNVVAQNI